MALVEIVRVDYGNPKHAADLVAMLDHYASDPAGGGEPLSEEARTNLVPRLSLREDAVSALAYLGDRAVGVLNCLEGFSTFQARPLLNIHDIAVHADYRRRGVGRQLLQMAEEIARQRDCCKITLEVLSNNESAIHAYREFGFELYELSPGFGTAVFMQKSLLENLTSPQHV